MRRPSVGLTFCACLVACSGSVTTSGGGGTSSVYNAGGAGGNVNGPPVRGAFSVNIEAPPGCPLTTQTQDFPVVPGRHPVTATDKSGGIADQTVDGSGAAARLSCTWFGDVADGVDRYTIEASMMLGPPGNLRTAHMNGTLTAGTSSKGGAEITTKDLPDGDYAGDCDFNIIQVDPTTRSIWCSFSCASFDKVADDIETPIGCSLGPSYFYFDNCTPL